MHNYLSSLKHAIRKLMEQEKKGFQKWTVVHGGRTGVQARSLSPLKPYERLRAEIP